MLFADIAGTLSALGMNIVKAEAFANDAGIVVDSFLFADSFGTLELNPSEFGRFTQKVMDAVTKRTSVDGLMRARRHLHTAAGKDAGRDAHLLRRHGIERKHGDAGGSAGWAGTVAHDCVRDRDAGLRYPRRAHRHRRRARRGRLLPYGVEAAARRCAKGAACRRSDAAIQTLLTGCGVRGPARSAHVTNANQACGRGANFTSMRCVASQSTSRTSARWLCALAAWRVSNSYTCAADSGSSARDDA